MLPLNRMISPVAIAFFACRLVPGASAQTYTISIVGPGAGVASSGIGINKSGQIAGSYDDGARHRAFLWTNGAGAKDLGIYPGFPTGVDYSSLAADVNDAGVTVGAATTATNEMHAFQWQNGTMTDLGTLGGAESTAIAINNAGTVAGYSIPAAAAYPHAVIWDASGIHDLGVLDGSPESWARDINDNGLVALNSFVDSSLTVQHAVLFNGTGLRDLGTLPGDTQSEALALNNSGVVIGSSGANLTDTNQAVMWNPAGTPVPLGKLSGDTFSRASALNNVGEIVGTSGKAGATRAFYYAGGQMRDLNTLVAPGTPASITDGLGINDLGQIVGSASVNGIARAVLLNPIYGDTNASYAVDVKDVAAVLQTAGGAGVGASAAPIWLSDVTPKPASGPRGFGDGRLTITDAVRLLRHIRGKDPVWP